MTNEYNENEISSLFENLSVADFERATSAHKEVAYTEAQKDKLNAGVANWNRFVDTLIVTSRTSCRQDEFEPFAVLHNPEVRRHYTPDADETVIDYRRRLGREAAEMKATWFFTAMMAPGRAYDPDEGTPEAVNPDDPAELADALDSGDLEVCICWYAEMRENGLVRRRAGIIRVDEEGNAGKAVEGQIDDEHNPFHTVLEGV